MSGSPKPMGRIQCPFVSQLVRCRAHIVRAVLVGLFGLLHMGCAQDSSTPLGPSSTLPTFLPQFGVTEPEMVDSTFNEVRVGLTDIVTFSDTDGNTYQFDFAWNSSGHLLSLTSYFNDELVATDQVTWSGSQAVDHYVDAPDGDWVATDLYNDPVEAEIETPEGPLEIEPQFMMVCGPSALCGEMVIYSFSFLGCEDEISDWIGSSVGVFGRFMVAVGSTTIAIVNPEPLTKTASGLVAVGTWTLMALKVREMGDDYDDMKECLEEM